MNKLEMLKQEFGDVDYDGLVLEAAFSWGNNTLSGAVDYLVSRDFITFERGVNFLASVLSD